MIVSEFETYDKFAAWIKRNFASQNNLSKLKIFQCMRLSGNLECDLIGIRKYERANKHIIISVEVKISNFTKVLQQAIIRSKFSNYTYIAIAGFSDLSYNIQLLLYNYETLRKHKIGVLAYDELRNRIFEFVHAHNNTVFPDIKRRNEIITRYHSIDEYFQEVKR